METASSGHDPAFLALMAAVDEGDFDRRLETLLTSVDRPVRDAIHRTLRSHFRVNAGSALEDAEDLRNEAMVLLVQKLRELRTEASAEPIQNFQAYASAVAAHACHAYLRRRYPEWTRLKNQVRYVLAHDPHLALRHSEAEEWTCVLTAWDAGAGRGPHRVGATVGERGSGIDAHGLSLRELIKAFLRRENGAMAMNALVSAIADIRGIRDGGVTPVPISDALEDPLSRQRGHGSRDDASFLKQVWEQVGQLPLRQRMALLLNLRDDRGRGVLVLFPHTGTASVGQIADALGMPPEELARIWNDLPIDDRRIAERLGISRQQVINLRKAARARLARRMAE